MYWRFYNPSTLRKCAENNTINKSNVYWQPQPYPILIKVGSHWSNDIDTYCKCEICLNKTTGSIVETYTVKKLEPNYHNKITNGL